MRALTKTWCSNCCLVTSNGQETRCVAVGVRRGSRQSPKVGHESVQTLLSVCLWFCCGLLTLRTTSQNSRVHSQLHITREGLWTKWRGKHRMLSSVVQRARHAPQYIVIPALLGVGVLLQVVVQVSGRISDANGALFLATVGHRLHLSRLLDCACNSPFRLWSRCLCYHCMRCHWSESRFGGHMAGNHK